MEQEDIKSKFNDGVNQIMRLNNSWNQCLYYSKQGDFERWRWTLAGIWRELAADDKKEIYASTIKALEILIKRAIEIDDREQYYKLLTKMEITLRKLQNESGKGGKYDDDGDGMWG